jgi:uncharacterized protein
MSSAGIEMSCYVDTSAWIALLAHEKTSASVATWMELGEPLVTARWTAVEIASAMSIKSRRGEISQQTVSQICEAFRSLIAIGGVAIPSHEDADFQEASLMCEDVSRKIRGGDALHLAVAQRVGCLQFLSFDDVLNTQAVQMGFELIALQ